MTKQKGKKKAEKVDDVLVGDKDILTNQEGNDSDSETDDLRQEKSIAMATKKKSKKQKKGKAEKDEDDIDDIELDMEHDMNDLDLNDEPQSMAKKSKKEKKKQKKLSKFDADADAEVDDEIDEDEPTDQFIGGEKYTSLSVLASMMALEDNDSDSENGIKSEEEDIIKQLPVKAETKSSKQKKKKEKKIVDKKEEDIDALLAEIEAPAEKEKKSKKKKKSTIVDNTNDSETGKEVPGISIDTSGQMLMDNQSDMKDDLQREGVEVVDDNNEPGVHLKTAAEKKKEKKERQKQKKAQKDTQKPEEVKDTQKPEEVKDTQKPEEVLVEDKDVTEEDLVVDEIVEQSQENTEELEGEKSSKKKKDRKKKDDKEEKKKKPANKQIKAMQEALAFMKEQEERQKQEEEEKERKLEELLKQKDEQKCVEVERKLKKKQKEKERKERLKKEGKLLTDKQRQDRQRAMQMLEVMKAQGIEIPQTGDEIKKKKPMYTKKKKIQQKQESIEDEETISSLTSNDASEKDDVKESVENAEEVADSWDADDNVADNWDDDTQDKPEKKAETRVESKVAKDIKKQVFQEPNESEDEASSDEESETSEEETSSESSSDDDDLTPIERARTQLLKYHEECEAKRSVDVLRAPVVCVLGHVDTGKTKLLDKLRHTNVQDGEAGGITQQIGATNVPQSAIIEATKMCKEFSKKELKLPGLLIIDTPGHESFSNLRSRGSSLCDIAILVVDIMHGLEPQTIESINLLRSRKTPFIVALNKVDRLFNWKTNPQNDVVNTIKKQAKNTKDEFDERTQEVIVQLAEQGLNACLFNENKNVREYVSLVPTSAHSGDGMGNLLALICELTQTLLAKRLSFTEELQATVMEVKAIHGLGTTIDVIIVNGSMRESDTIIAPGTEGPIVTQVRGLLLPQPMKELRVKGQYAHLKKVDAAQGCKIIAKDLDKSLPGLPIYVAHNQDQVEYYKEELSKALKEALSSIKLTERGVFVQASTLGSLEALLEFLRTSKIPYAGINIGPVHKKDIMKASVMLEHDNQWAVILAFDVKIEREAQELADSLGVKIFTADIIYHLFDNFIAHREELKKQRQDEFRHIAVFPCKIRVLPQFVFKSRDPIVCGVQIEAGFVKQGTLICVPSKEMLILGRISSIEANHKEIPMAKQGQEVCIKIEAIPGEAPKMFGRHFDHTDLLYSKISRASIDAVKNYFREEMSKSDWQLIMEMKKLFEIL